MKLNTNIHYKQVNTNFIGGTNNYIAQDTSYNVFDGIIFIILISQIVILLYIRDYDDTLNKLNKDYEEKQTVEKSEKDIDLHKTKINSILTTLNKYEQFYSYSLTILIVLLIQLTPQAFPVNLLTYGIEYPDTFDGLKIMSDINPEDILKKFLNIADTHIDSHEFAKYPQYIIEKKITLPKEVYDNEVDFIQWSINLIAYINYKKEQLTNYSSIKDLAYYNDIQTLLYMLDFSKEQDLHYLNDPNNAKYNGKYIREFKEFINGEILKNNNKTSVGNDTHSIISTDYNIANIFNIDNIHIAVSPYYSIVNRNYDITIISKDIILYLITLIYLSFLLCFNEFDFISTKSSTLFLLINCIISYSLYNINLSPGGYTYAIWASYIIILILSLMSSVGDNYFIVFDDSNKLPVLDIDDWKKFPIITHQISTIYDYNKYYKERMNNPIKKLEYSEKERITINTKLYLSIKKLFVFVLGVLLGMEFYKMLKFIRDPTEFIKFSKMIGDPTEFSKMIGDPNSLANITNQDNFSFNMINIGCIIFSIIIYIVQMYFFNSIDFITIIYIIISSIYIINPTTLNKVPFFDNIYARGAFIFLFSGIFGYCAYINRQDTIDYKLHYQHKKTQRLKDYEDKLNRLTSILNDTPDPPDDSWKNLWLRVIIYAVLTLVMIVNWYYYKNEY